MIAAMMEPDLGPEQPHACPVCGSTKVQASNRQSMTHADDPDNAIITGILGYRCANGHVSIAAGLYLR